jgi:hypothetical protein
VKSELLAVGDKDWITRRNAVVKKLADMTGPWRNRFQSANQRKRKGGGVITDPANWSNGDVAPSRGPKCKSPWAAGASSTQLRPGVGRCATQPKGCPAFDLVRERRMRDSKPRGLAPNRFPSPRTTVSDCSYDADERATK